MQDLVVRVVHGLAADADVGAGPEHLLGPAAQAARAVGAVAPVVAAGVGPLPWGEGKRAEVSIYVLPTRQGS